MSGKQEIVREFNERIRALHRGFGSASGTCFVLCECDDAACLERIQVPVDAFDSHDSTLFVAPGHTRARAVAA